MARREAHILKMIGEKEEMKFVAYTLNIITQQEK